MKITGGGDTPMNPITPSNPRTPRAGNNVDMDCETSFGLGRNLGETAWQQLECDADAALCLSEVFCSMLAQPGTIDALNFIRCLCQQLDVEPTSPPAPETERHFVEAVYIGFSETLVALQEDGAI
jgi:hypothetical protein